MSPPPLKANEKLSLYSHRRCPFAIRVRMLLHEKNLPFLTIEEDLKNISEKIRSLHPEAKVPVLVHSKADSDFVVYESAVITEYVDDAFPGHPLFPKAPEARAQIRLWTYWCNQIFKRDIDILKYGASRLTQDALDQGELEKGPNRLEKHLEKLEGALSAREFLMGKEFSLADIHVFPFVRQLSRVEPVFPALEKAENVKFWLDKILSRPSFEKTMSAKH